MHFIADQTTSIDERRCIFWNIFQEILCVIVPISKKLFTFYT